eukprot:scaffold80241_cov23-Cyclotella_meneghiniana.AAC.1
MVHHSAGHGLPPKVSRRARKAISSSGSWVQVCRAVCQAKCTLLYADFQSTLQPNILVFGYFLLAATCQFMIRLMQWPYRTGAMTTPGILVSFSRGRG